MDASKFYFLPRLAYKINALEPYISQEQLRIHYKKHHQKYIDNANLLLEKLDKARKKGEETEIQCIAKELSFNVGGHILHSLFWNNLISPQEGGGKKPSNALKDAINKEFGSFERFVEEASKTAMKIEGSGWAALVFDKLTNRLLLAQIEKHNINIFPELNILMVADIWEHAYYIDYKNERAEYIRAFWKIINWENVERRLELAVI